MRDPALVISGLAKTFPGTQALRGVALEVGRGEVHALLGHNGSGKSTLVKVLAGFHRPDGRAHATVLGKELELGSASEAARLGIRFVHQDLGLVSELSAVDNVALTTGYLRQRSGRVAQAAQVARTRELLDKFGIELNVTRPLGAATPVQRTAVAIARALWDWQEGTRVLVLDEPTAALPSREVDQLFAVVREVQRAGHAVIYVSHRMDEIFALADHVTVLRNGAVVGGGPLGDHTPQGLSALIAGHDLTKVAGDGNRRTLAEVAMDVRGIEGTYLRGVDLQVKKGEILGIAGLAGSGREELPYVLAGALPATFTAPWRLARGSGTPRTPLAAQQMGIAFVPAERAREGLIADFTVRENITLAALKKIRRSGRIAAASERRFAARWMSAMGLAPEVADRAVSTLSGGNQQKALLARWVSMDPDVMVLSEPTAGVDVGARQALYALLTGRADDGMAVVIASSDIEDLLICDRVMVLRDGVVVDVMTSDEIDVTRIISHMEGAHA